MLQIQKLFCFYLSTLILPSFCADNSPVFHRFSDLPLELQLHIFDPHHRTGFTLSEIFKSHHYLTLVAKCLGDLRTFEIMTEDLPFFLERYCSGDQPFCTKEMAEMLKMKIKPINDKNRALRDKLSDFLQKSSKAFALLDEFNTSVTNKDPNLTEVEEKVFTELNTIFNQNPLVRIASEFWLKNIDDSWHKMSLKKLAQPSKKISQLFNNQCWDVNAQTKAYNFQQFIDASMYDKNQKLTEEFYKKIGKELAKESFIEKFMQENRDPYTFLFHRNTLLHNYLKYVSFANLKIDLIKKMIDYKIDPTAPNLFEQTAIFIAIRRADLLYQHSNYMDVIDLLLQQSYVNVNYNDPISLADSRYYKKLLLRGALLRNCPPFNSSFLIKTIRTLIHFPVNDKTLYLPWHREQLDIAQLLIDNGDKQLWGKYAADQCMWQEVIRSTLCASVFQKYPELVVDWFNLLNKNNIFIQCDYLPSYIYRNCSESIVKETFSPPTELSYFDTVFNYFLHTKVPKYYLNAQLPLPETIDEKTLLSIILRQGGFYYPNMVHTLLQKGFEPTTCDYYGMDAINYALHYKRFLVAPLLLQRVPKNIEPSQASRYLRCLLEYKDFPCYINKEMKHHPLVTPLLQYLLDVFDINISSLFLQKEETPDIAESILIALGARMPKDAEFVKKERPRVLYTLLNATYTNLEIILKHFQRKEPNNHIILPLAAGDKKIHKTLCKNRYLPKYQLFLDYGHQSDFYLQDWARDKIISHNYLL